MCRHATKLALIFVLLWGAFSYVSVSQAAPLPQDPRPSDGDSGEGGGGGGDGGSDSSDSSASETRCASLQGDVIHWGVGAMAGIGSKLSTGSWEISATSSSDGKYSLGGLGVGIATLHVDIPPAMQDTLTPLIQNAGVYLNCDYPTIANLAIYSGSEIDPPATIELTGPKNLSSGNEIPIKVTIKNNLPNDITNVIVTSLMPSGLIATNVEAAAAEEDQLKIINGGADGQLVAAFLDTVASGDELNLFITVTVDDDAEVSGSVQQIATLFYRESAAAQAAIDFTIGSDNGAAPVAPLVEPVVVTPTLVISAAQTTPTETPAAVEAEATTEAMAMPTVEPTVEAESDEDFVPPNGLPKTGDTEMEEVTEPIPPDMLPVTGNNPFFGPNGQINPMLAVAAAGLIVLIVLGYGLRSVRRTGE
ncbi:MAG: hypothetical protein KDJ52_05380 [Anaerolineae bacterium]|nr:hypothetical protein [Anaerolineae bacterium]